MEESENKYIMYQKIKNIRNSILVYLYKKELITEEIYEIQIRAKVKEP